MDHAELGVRDKVWHLGHGVSHPVSFPLPLFVQLLEHIVYLLERDILSSRELVVSLALGYVFNVVFIRFVTNLAVRVVFVRDWLQLGNFYHAKVVICLNMTLLVFACLLCPQFFDFGEIVDCIFFLCPCSAGAVAVRNLSFESVVVVRLKHDSSSKVRCVQ